MQEQDRRRWKEKQAEVILCLLIRSPTASRAGCNPGSNRGKSSGFRVPRSRTGREMLLGGLSLREAKQALQGLIPGRMRTAGPCGIVPGKRLADHRYPPSTCWEETTARETTLAMRTSYCTSQSIPPNLHVGSSAPAPAPSGRSSVGHVHHPGRGRGHVCRGTGLPQHSRTSARLNACSHKTERC